MTHDPLCPEPDYPIARKCPSCWNYSTVREDERANVTAEFMSNHGGRWEYEAGVAAGRAEALGIRVREVMPYAHGYFDGEDHMLAKCIAAVRPVVESQIRFAANLWSCDPMNCELCDCVMDSAGRQQIADTARSQAEMVLDALRALQKKP